MIVEVTFADGITKPFVTESEEHARVDNGTLVVHEAAAGETHLFAPGHWVAVTAFTK